MEDDTKAIAIGLGAGLGGFAGLVSRMLTHYVEKKKKPEAKTHKRDRHSYFLFFSS
jgi:sulfite reductase alpha subunit-like flavoprotein